MSLAERLVSDGVDVVLDLWELREGQDKYAFMERMVNDGAISKVLAICDKPYAQKADSRKKGVGTESQIMSKEIYDKIDQRKFVAILTEYFEDGEPCLPAFFKTRKFIDMSSEEKLQGNYEQLLRFIFDRPLHQKPTLGQLPAFIFDSERVASKTASKLALTRQAILGDRSTVPGLIGEYLTLYAAALEDYRITEQITSDFDEKVFANITSFVPYRDEFLEFVDLVASHRDDKRTYEEIHAFFEMLLAYLHPPEGVTSWQDAQFDNYRFILFELFIYTFAILLKKRRFHEANLLLELGYLDERQTRYGHSSIRRYPIFDQYPASLEEYRKRRLQLRWYSVTGHLLKERSSQTSVRFDDLVETDFILFLRGVLDSQEPTWGSDYWQPRTASYSEYRGIFPLFAKATARRVFDQLRVVLGVQSKEDLEDKLKRAKEQDQIPGRRPFSYFNFEGLMNLNDLDTK